MVMIYKMANNLYNDISRTLSYFKKNISNIFQFFLMPCMVFVLGKALYENVFETFWKFLELEDNLALRILIVLFSVFGIYLGACAARKILDICHKKLVWLAVVVYLYYKFFFIYSSDGYYPILIWKNMDGFAIFGLSIVLGFVGMKICTLIRKSVLKKYADKEQIVDSDPIIPICIDEPIKNTKDDLFHYSKLAKSLAYTIQRKPFLHSYSIGICSPWGAGKTSFLNLLKKELTVNDDIVVVEFNARASTKVECIQGDFLSLLASTLAPFHTGMKSVVQDYMSDLNLLVADTPWAKLLGLLHVKDASNSRKKLQDGIIATRKKIVVMIDDLDRLTCSEILEVLKLITKNAAFRNTVFLTTYDKAYVNSVLEKSMYFSNNQNFSDKYFNMEIDLPKSNDSFRSSFLLNEFIKLGKEKYLTACSEQELRECFISANRYIEHYLLTLRDVKRFLNTFCASYIPIQHEVYFFDYLLLSLLKYAKKEIYDDIKELNILQDTAGIVNKNIYVLKNSHKLDGLEAELVSRLFPGETSNRIGILNEKGQKHICWKRSFNAYFYNLEYTSLHQEDLNKLLKGGVTDYEIRQLSYDWKQRKIEVDIKDFLVKIEDYQKDKSQLKAYLRLCMICYRYTLEKDIFFIAARYLYYYSWNEKNDKFKFQTKEKYKKYIEEIIESSSDINASSVFMHQMLFYQLSENQIKAEDCVFTDKELQKICLWRLKEGLDDFKEKKITGSDILYLTLSCVDDADPSDSGSYGFTIIPEAKKLLEQSIWENPNEYLFKVITHKKANGNNIQFYINEDNPFGKIFAIGELEEIINKINVESDDNLLTVCNFWSEYLQYCIAQNTLSPVVSFKGAFEKLKGYDYKQYNLIMEGEEIQ